MATFTPTERERAATPAAQEIRYWMSTPPVTINVAAQLSDALALMHEHSIRRLPVVTATGEVCGIITAGDIRGANVLHASGMDVREIASSLQHIAVHEVMAEAPITVTPATGLRQAALLMLDNKIAGLPVVDDQNTVVGVVTESDLFEALICYLDDRSRPGR